MINIVGNIFGSSGYSIHTRELTNALSKITDVRLSTNFIKNWKRHITDKELELIKKEPEDNEINLIITNPISWRQYTGERNIAYLVWEGDKIPKCFIDEILNPEIERVIVPSEHTKKAVMDTPTEIDTREKIAQKIRVIPHGVDPDKFYPKKTKKDKFTFLANKGFKNILDRGGIQYLIEAYTKEFEKDENVNLILKINPAYGLPDFENVLKKLTNKEEVPSIQIIKEQIPYKELINVYKKGDVFVSPTRAEAFNIPCLEAMACGLPVITTNFGGQTDYVNKKNGKLIKGELEPVRHEIQYEGIKWLTPSIKDLRKALRQAYTQKTWVSSRKKQALQTAKEYPWTNSAKMILELIQ